MSEHPPICDYEGSDYQSRFWGNNQRAYEDQVERIALRRLMPARGSTLLDVGAGFGRLADEYNGYERVVLMDYSSSLLRQARERIGDDPRFIFAAADWYKMPFVTGAFETLVQVRTLHHAADAPALMQQLARVSKPTGQFILEFANKRNLKAMGRYALKRQSWSPYTEDPVEFVELNFNFHPEWIVAQLRHAGFSPQQTLSVSHFRFGPLKRLVPTKLLVSADKRLQATGRRWQYTPSIFVASDMPTTNQAAPANALLACPECHTPLGDPNNDAFTCTGCGLVWGIEHGVINFKTPQP